MSGTTKSSPELIIKTEDMEVGTSSNAHNEACDEITVVGADIIPVESDDIMAGSGGASDKLGTSPVSSDQHEGNTHLLSFGKMGSYGGKHGEGDNETIAQMNGLDFSSPSVDSHSLHHALATPSPCSMALPPTASVKMTTTGNGQEMFEQPLPPVLGSPLPSVIQRFQGNVLSGPSDIELGNTGVSHDGRGADQSYQMSHAYNDNVDDINHTLESPADPNNIESPADASNAQQEVAEPSANANASTSKKSHKKTARKASTREKPSGEDTATSKPPRRINKRLLAKRRMEQDMKKGAQLAQLARENKITDEQLLEQRPKKMRRPARFVDASPSRFCHICSRTPKSVRLVVCQRIQSGLCRKVVCEKCFIAFDLGDFEKVCSSKQLKWLCSHCTDKCPPRAQCRTYGKINERLRLERLKQPRRENTNRKSPGARNPSEDNEDQNKNDAIERQEEAEESIQVAEASLSLFEDTRTETNEHAVDVAKPVDALDNNDFCFLDIQSPCIPELQSLSDVTNGSKQAIVSAQVDVESTMKKSQQFATGVHHLLSRPQESPSSDANQWLNDFISPIGSVKGTSSQMTSGTPPESQVFPPGQQITAEHDRKGSITEVDISALVRKPDLPTINAQQIMLPPADSVDENCCPPVINKDEGYVRTILESEEGLNASYDPFKVTDGEDKVIEMLYKSGTSDNANKLENKYENMTGELGNEYVNGDKKMSVDHIIMKSDPEIDWGIVEDDGSAAIAGVQAGSSQDHKMLGATEIGALLNSSPQGTLKNAFPLVSPFQRAENNIRNARSGQDEGIPTHMLDWYADDIEPYVFAGNQAAGNQESSLYVRRKNGNEEQLKPDHDEARELMKRDITDGGHDEVKLDGSVENEIAKDELVVGVEIKDTLRLWLNEGQVTDSALNTVSDLMAEKEGVGKNL